MSDKGQDAGVRDEVVPLDGDQAVGFDVVRFGGYDRRQVDDYLDRIEVALDEADQRHADDSARLQALQAEVAQVQQRVSEAEQRTADQPETASALTGRLAEMLALAEQEAAHLRAQARTEVEQVLAAAKERAAEESALLTSDLQRRERDVATAVEHADVVLVKAQRDADTVRSQAERESGNQVAVAKREAEAMRANARRETEALLEQARQDIQGMHEQGRRDDAAATTEARRELERLSRQRDSISAQLQQLRDAVSAAVGPLSASSVTGSAETGPVRQGRDAGSRRV